MSAEKKLLISELKKRKITHKAVETQIGISRVMLSRKLHGKTQFSLKEAIDIHERFVPDIPIEILFQ